jgi:hypothetical protein
MCKGQDAYRLVTYASAESGQIGKQGERTLSLAGDLASDQGWCRGYGMSSSCCTNIDSLSNGCGHLDKTTLHHLVG